MKSKDEEKKPIQTAYKQYATKGAIPGGLYGLGAGMAIGVGMELGVMATYTAKAMIRPNHPIIPNLSMRDIIIHLSATPTRAVIRTVAHTSAMGAIAGIVTGTTISAGMRFFSPKKEQEFSKPEYSFKK